MSGSGGYTSISDLPATIREELPSDAQELYLAAYNQALEDRTDDDTLCAEIVAHNAAMRQVKNEFSYDSEGRWKSDPIGEHMDETGPRQGR